MPRSRKRRQQSTPIKEPWELVVKHEGALRVCYETSSEEGNGRCGDWRCKWRTGVFWKETSHYTTNMSLTRNRSPSCYCWCHASRDVSVKIIWTTSTFVAVRGYWRTVFSCYVHQDKKINQILNKNKITSSSQLYCDVLATYSRNHIAHSELECKRFLHIVLVQLWKISYSSR